MVFLRHFVIFFDRSGAQCLFFTHFPQVRLYFCLFSTYFPAGAAYFCLLWAPQDRAAKTHCRRLGRQVVFFNLKNTIWRHFFEAQNFWIFRAPKSSRRPDLPDPQLQRSMRIFYAFFHRSGALGLQIAPRDSARWCFFKYFSSIL